MRTLSVLLILFGATWAAATDWYVSTDASGSNDGTSWSDAWSNTSEIVWGSVSGGDTVYFDGGTSGLSYDALSVGANGSAGNYITLRCSQEANRNGLVTLVGSHTFSGRDWIAINGAKDDSYTPPTSVANLHDITNNIGFRLSSTTGNVLTWSDANHLTLSYVEVVGIENATEESNEYHGVFLNDPDLVDGSVIEYCWVHDTTRYGIGNNGASDWVEGVYTNLLIHHTIVEGTADDQLVWSFPGVTVHHCVIGPKLADVSAGHPDSTQIYNGSGWYRYYNNIVSDPRNALLWQTLDASATNTVGNVGYYGNVVYISSGWSQRSNMNYGAQFTAWGNGSVVSNVTYSNIVIANNTVYNSPSYGFRVTNRDTDAGQQLWSATLTNVVIKNNIILECGKTETGGYLATGVLAVDGPGWTDPGGTAGLFYASSDVSMDYNVVYADDGVVKIDYGGTTWDDADAFNAAGYYTNNSAAEPTFVSLGSADFRLSAADSVALNAGDDLSLLGLPGLTTDLWGNTRGSDGTWDIGANEYTPSGLVVHYTFSDSFTNGTITDASGSGNPGLRFGYPGGTTNWPVAVAVTNGLNASTGAEFAYYNDGYGSYNRSGDYIGITNLQAGACSNVTVMLFAKYDAAPAGDNYIDMQNAAMVNNGQYTVAGAWFLGRENYYTGATGTQRTKFTVWRDGVDANRSQTLFNDTCAVDGSTASMIHYAVTFDAGTIILYQDGSAIATDTTAQATINLDTQTRYLGIGCGPHHGSITRDPWMDPDGDQSVYDEYPNWRFFNGKMDDLRIYTSTLTAEEVATLYEAGSGIDPNAGDWTDDHNSLTAGMKIGDVP